MTAPTQEAMAMVGQIIGHATGNAGASSTVDLFALEIMGIARWQCLLSGRLK
ncbi:MAG: hypothetical protein IPK48_13715 [Gammaproteobacteria bacterium]|nr:hypothetical protein [Gammaproteobacteria bacterium]